MNVLLLSAGTRNRLVRYFKESSGGKVVATDMSRTAPAIYEADKFYIVPRITAPDYVDHVLDICKKEDIEALVSLIDPELSLIAENKARFDELGVTIIGSDYERCELAFNKMSLFRWMSEHGYKCSTSFDSLDEFKAAYKEKKIDFPVVVKPICGSASMSINHVNDLETLEVLWKNSSGMMIQERLDGQEIGADCYIDLVSGEVVSIFTKNKLRMRAGETDKSVSFKDEKLFSLVESFVTECGFMGQVDIDLFEVDGVYYISEVNPRFGGGYPHAHECGCNHILLIKNNIEGRANEKNIGFYDDGVYMMKYVEIMVKKCT